MQMPLQLMLLLLLCNVRCRMHWQGCDFISCVCSEGCLTHVQASRGRNSGSSNPCCSVYSCCCR